MKRETMFLFAVTAVLSASAAELRISAREFRDRMEGAWIGQSVGSASVREDLSVEVSFISVLERHGLDVPCRTAGIEFANSRYHLWRASSNARNNLRKGIAAPASSHPKYHPTTDDVDYQVEADYSGIIAPGLPQAAVDLGETFGRIICYGDGLYAGQFTGALYANAYFETNPVKVVEHALKAIPAECGYAQMVRDLLAWHKDDPKDWEKAWKKAADRFSAPRNNVRINGARMLLGFLWGEGDMDRTMRIATQGGFGSACNPSTACGVLGTMIGAKRLIRQYPNAPKRTNRWEGVSFSWPRLMRACEGLAHGIVVKYGGRVEKDDKGRTTLVIRTGDVKPSAFFDSKAPGPVPADERLTDEERELVHFRPCGEGATSEIWQAGVPVETAKWQQAIDAASAKGGGRVVIPKGFHVTGHLKLRNGVELHFEDGAILEAVVDAAQYARVGSTHVEGGICAGLITAEGVTNVAVTGRGLIRGNKKVFPDGNMNGLYFHRCTGVRLEDFTLRDSCGWNINVFCSEDVVIRRVTISSHAGHCTDGIDLEARNALIEDCDVDAGDDAICLKSNDARFTVENVLVRNCIAHSHCNAFKLGTSTHGVMRNIRFEHCRSEAAKRINNDVGTMPKDLTKWRVIPGAMWYLCGPAFGAINIECVDGGLVENVTFDDIEVYGASMPIFVRGGERGGRQKGFPHLEEYVLRNIVIQNVRGQAEASAPSTVTGTDKCRVRNVTLRNIEIACLGDSGKDRRETSVPGAELTKHYPQPNMFGRYRLPSYGLFADKVDGLTCENVRFTLRPGTTDAREEFFSTTNCTKILRKGK